MGERRGVDCVRSGEVGADRLGQPLLPDAGSIAELRAKSCILTLVDSQRGRGLGRLAKQIFGNRVEKRRSLGVTGGGDLRPDRRVKERKGDAGRQGRDRLTAAQVHF